MNDTPETAPARSRFVAVALGAVLFVVLDSAVGTLLGMGRVVGFDRWAIFAQIVLAHAAVLGLGAGLAAALLHAALGRFRIDLKLFRPTASTCVLGLLAAVAVEVLNWELFRGPAIVNWKWRVPVETAFRILGPPGTFVAVLVAAAAVERKGALRRVAGLCSAGVALGLLYGSATIYRRQYPDLHLQMALAAFGSCAAAVHGLCGGTKLDFAATRARAVVVGGLLVALFVGLFPARDLPRFPSVKGVALERADGVGRLARYSGRIVDAVSAGGAVAQEPTVDVTELMGKFGSGDDAEMQKRLDAVWPDRKKLNVLVLAVDTLRADHCGFLNPGMAAKYGRSPTPNLDALAAESFVFETTYTPYPTSSYAFNSIFMSIAPRLTKVYTDKYDPAKKHDPLHPYPALLAQKGWRTAAVSSFNEEDLANPRKFKHLKEGFEIFNPRPFESAASAPQVTDAATEMFTKIGAEGRLPFFAWVHYMDPHSPYQHNAGFDFGPNTKDWYVSDIAYADHHVGKFVEHLKRQNLWDDTVVVVLSDHGEEFGEHGGREHNCSVYEEQVRVPFMIKLPKIDPQGRRVTSTVSLLDLVPTLNRLLKVDDPVRRMGRSLLPLMFGAEDPEGGFAYSEWFEMTGNFRTQERHAFTLGRRKIIRRVNEKAFELYDLKADPGEKASLIGEAPDEAQMKALLAEWDRRIDSYFGGDGAEAASRPSPTATYDAIFAKIRDLNAAAKSLAKSDPAQSREKASAARAAVVEYRNALMSGYGDVMPHVANALEPAELDVLFTRLAEIYPDLGDGAAAEVVITLARLRDRRFLPIYKGELEPLKTGEFAKLRPGAVEALLALSSFEDPEVVPALRALYQDPAIPFKGAIAAGLARLGDLTGAEWFVLNLASLRFGWVYRDTILAMPKVFPQLPLAKLGFPPARVVRDRLTEEDFRQSQLESAFVEALSADPHEEATTLLFRYGRHGSEIVRNAALKELKKRVTDETVFARRLDAADEELTADGMLLNGVSEAATPTYGRALEKGGVFNAGVRFRMARAFHKAGAVDRAREALAEIAEKAPLEVDRLLARRRIGQLKWPVNHDPAQFRCEVVSFTPPPVVRTAQYYAVKARLKNTGTEPWWGGYSKDSMDVGLRFVLADGSIVETQDDKNITNRLREEGVEPGEEVEVHLLGWGPRQKIEGRLAVVFRHDRNPNLPKKGMVYVAPEATVLDAATKPATRPASRPATPPK